MEFKLTISRRDEEMYHRGHVFHTYVQDEYGHEIDGVKVGLFIIQLEHDKKWYAVTSSTEYDDCFDDIGPYDNPEDVLLFLKLTHPLVEID